jgi:hypothetical protein
VAQNIRVPDSPLAESPYAVLGVPENATDAALRRAYRKKLRETHPDTGGDARRFDLVQRAWELVGTPDARRAYDSGAVRDEEPVTWAPRSPTRQSTRPQARSHGHPGGWYREQYLTRLQEWVGRGDPVADPYDPLLVRSAPVEVRHLLASAVAEEETAVALSTLGIGFTIWHDVGPDPADKIDHVVLGPTGLWAMLSEDFGGEVSVRRGDLVGEGLHPDDRPLAELAHRARAFEKAAKVRFSALVIVVGDGASAEGVLPIGKVRGAPALLVQRPRLAHLVRTGVPGVGIGGTDLFELRTRVQAAARFV